MASSRSLKNTRCTLLKALTLALIFLLVNPTKSNAYSVLAHEAVVDSAWDDAIKPLLLKRFPVPPPSNSRKRIRTPTAAPSFRTWATTLLEATYSVISYTTSAPETSSKLCSAIRRTLMNMHSP